MENFSAYSYNKLINTFFFCLIDRGAITKQFIIAAQINLKDKKEEQHKKVICSSFIFGLFCVTSQANWNGYEVVRLEQEQDVLDFMNSEEYDYQKAYGFCYDDAPSFTKAVCYMCGAPTLGTRTAEEQIGGRTITYPYSAGLGPDVLSTFAVNQYERCTACGYRVLIGQIGTKYYVYCTTTEETWEASPNYTLEGGYDSHQCLNLLI